MACLVTADEVKEIMDSCILTTTQMEPYLVTAHRFVDAVLSTSSEEKRTEVEKWFAAHLIASVHYRTTLKERVGDAEVGYGGKFEDGLSSTPYGQVVLQLDTTGKMAMAGKKGASMYAIKSFEE